tara:strand:- start:2592 stop:3692 length:1101 start_codon:yes stop_codon:yes gene_type:complete
MTSNFTYRYLAITPEHTTSTGVRTYGTASALSGGSGTNKIYGEVDDESIQYRFDLMTRSDMSRYGAKKSVNGKEYSEGGINFVAQPDDLLGLCFYGIYGDSTANEPPSGGGYTISNFVHTWTEDKTNVLPSFTIEVGREEKEHTYTGMCINRLGISAAHGEYVTVSADFSGKRESGVATLESSVTFSGAAVDGFHFADGTVNFSETGSAEVSSTKIKSISIDFNMNLDTDAACSIGDRTYIRQPEPQMREITGTVEFSDASTTSATNVPGYDMLLTTGGKLYDGSSAASFLPAMSLDFTNGTQSLSVDIRKVRWEAPTSNVSGRDTQTLSLNFVALVDNFDNMSRVILTQTADSSNLATGVKYSEI